MNRNVAKGILASINYIHLVETSIKKAYPRNETIKDETNYLNELKQYQNTFFEEIAKKVNSFDITYLDESTKRQAYFCAMFDNSKRIRPLFLYLGYLCNDGKIKKENLVSCGVAIEMIHKMSVILDDYFDNELTRRNFHSKYDANTMLEISKLLLDLSNYKILEGTNLFPIEQQKRIIKLYQQIIIDMGNGFLEDINRSERKIELEEAYRINDLQSTTILKNALLIGYSLTDEKNIEPVTYNNLINIGAQIGRMMQGFNDVENFIENTRNRRNNTLYSDLKENRKNIVLGKVPKELFYFPYTNEDIIEFIRENHLLENTMEELIVNRGEIKESIQKLPRPIARDTFLYLTDKVMERKLKKVESR